AADLRVLSNGLRQFAGRPARVRMDVAVRTEAVLLQQVPISSLALSLQEHPPRVRMDVAVHTEAVLLQQIPISSLALSPVGAPAPGASGAGGFRTEAVLLQQIPISSLALSLQEHPPRVRINWVLRLLVHCCGGACAILLRLGNHPVTEPLQGRRLGLAL